MAGCCLRPRKASAILQGTASHTVIHRHTLHLTFFCSCVHMMRQGYAENVSNASDLPMLDLVLAVEDSEAWHKANLER